MMTQQGRSTHRRTARRRAGWRATVLGLAVLASTVMGCAPAGGGSDGVATALPDTPPPATSESAPALPVPPPPRPDPVPPADCDDDVLGGVGATIGGQLAAFADGDFVRAYGFASQGFRGTVPLEAFEVIVRDGYAALLDLTSHEVLECRTDGRRAAVLVGVVDAAGTPSLMSYDLVRESDGWRIQGAQGAGPGQPAITA
jgi:hypothetical protein